MGCSRCGGFMVVDEFMDAREEYSRMWCQVLRCINCGAIEDEVFRMNRLSTTAPRRSTSS